jgi:hypothetical protein
MDGQHTIYSHEGVFTVRAGIKFESAEGTLALARDVQLPYLDWRGACAGVYMQHPVDKKRTLNCGPNLGRLVGEGDVDIEEAAVGILTGIARNYRALLHAPDPATVKKELAEVQPLFILS